jgi:hypothetical protein
MIFGRNEQDGVSVSGLARANWQRGLYGSPFYRRKNKDSGEIKMTIASLASRRWRIPAI